MGIVVYDGDQGFGGDSFSLNGVAITDAQNPAGQFYNSTISELGANLPGRYPNYVNNLGLDIDRIQIPTGVMPNGSTSATIRAQTTSENIYIGVITFGTQLYVPIITPNIVKTATDLNGGLLLPGETLRYNISLSNTGLDTGTNVILTDRFLPEQPTNQIHCGSLPAQTPA